LNLTIRSALGRALAAEGLVTDLADTAADGLSRARAEVYDLVILDLLMPGTDGSAVPVGRAAARAPAEPPRAPRRIPGRASRTSSAGRASRTSAAGRASRTSAAGRASRTSAAGRASRTAGQRSAD
jgi:CheY-like chemotaxis protein